MKLLEIQSSVRQEGSISRSLSDEFVQAWQSFAFSSESIQAIFAVVNPEKLKAVKL